MVNALVASYPECAEASADPREGGLVHRLDTLTSGVLLAARDRETWGALRDAFSGRQVDKRYLAVVTGPVADEGEIDLPLRHRADHVEPALSGGGREALTDFRVLARAGDAALLEVRIHTGVLHQIRAHLAAIGAPVLGDLAYGGRPHPGLDRFFLHAAAARVRPPGNGDAAGALRAATARAPRGARAPGAPRRRLMDSAPMARGVRRASLHAPDLRPYREARGGWTWTKREGSGATSASSGRTEG